MFITMKTKITHCTKTNEPKTTAQMFFTVYYAEKGDKMLHHFQGKIDIGTGNGGIISQLKMQNEMKLTDESWISYQQGKGNEEYQKYMEDLTDMQNHVLPYLQSFCSLEEKGVKERREQQVAEKNESREAVPRTGGEANIAVKDACWRFWTRQFRHMILKSFMQRTRRLFLADISRNLQVVKREVLSIVRFVKAWKRF